jgi:hypothetical protein
MILTLSPCARALRNLINAADALAQLSPLDARALFAAPFGVNLYSVPSAALDLTGEHTGRAAVRVVELSAEVVIRVSAPTGAGAELSAPLTLELFQRLADGSCVRLIRDLERVEGAERLAPVWSLPIAPRTFARYNLARYALSYAGGVALFQAERGLMVEVLEALGAKGLAAKAAKAPAVELSAPVSVEVVQVEAPAPVSSEVVEAPAPVSSEVVADAWVDVERAKRHYTQALRASAEGSSVVSAAARRFLDAARALDQLNHGVEAPAYPADVYLAEARCAVRQAPMTAHRLALALALDVQALFSSTVTPSAELIEAARAWCAAEVAAGVPLAGFLARVVGRIVDLSLPAELPAPVVVEAPRVTLRPRALTLRALRLAVAAKRAEGARVEPRPALRYAARAPFRALSYLASRHPAIYALLTDTASEARMSWRSCPRAAAEALRWEALAQSDARGCGCSYCPAGYTWRGVARAVARAEAAAAKAPRRRRAR